MTTRRQDLAIDLQFRVASLDSPLKRKRHDDADNKQEQRHDHVPRREPDPFRVRHLVAKPVGNRFRNQLGDCKDDATPANDPKHVETTQARRLT